MAVLDMRALKAATESPPPAAAKPQPLVSPTMDIQVRYLDPEGVLHEGVLVSKVITDVDDKARMGRVLSRLAAPDNFDNMPETWCVWANAYAMCIIQLVDPPDWFSRWAPVHDALLYRVAEKLLKHNDIFFGAGAFTRETDAEQYLAVGAPDLDLAIAAAAEQG